ncbi:Bug family tripartite tricarboxylate transporter substrate binding protein [Marinomonas ostreistagni]|uniref:Tricarboxylate transporter n=1 Tax=Marinomonas ostreistagni TaxID=359209 RepID=A0ABS0ZFM8_9GAMM|nr:tricarboxylate transporter [Marinomonas ostreistagni]MBJ7552480.1 tricarboxylate transporter [Marinomonas ostreistagni]
MKKIVWGVMAGVSIACSSFSMSSLAQDFSGERIEWLVPFKEGGGTDTWARFFLPKVSESLPGAPTVVIKNVPGGGSINGANQFEARAKTDGTNVFGSTASTLFYYLLGDKRARYEPKDWQAVFATPTGGVMYVDPKLGINSPKDLAAAKDVEFIFPSLGPTSLDLVPLLAMDMLGMKVRPVFGMDRSAGRLAFERGEVNIDYQTSAPFIQKVMPLVDEGTAKPLLSWGVLDDDGNIVRDPSFPELPTFVETYEAIHGEKPSGQAFEVWKTFFIAGFAAQKIMFLPKEASSDTLQTYRNTMADVVKQPGFKEQASKAIGDYDQIVGKNVDAAVRMIFSLSAEDKKWIQQWLTERYNVKF